MHNDPIVDEIRRIRQEHADKFNDDLHAICEDLRRQERESGRRFVSFPPRRACSVGASKASDEHGGATKR